MALECQVGQKPACHLLDITPSTCAKVLKAGAPGIPKGRLKLIKQLVT
jgi:hypothetical protein